MAVTYNKINWDEETPITVANLDRIDVGIDEVVTQSNSNESRITTNEDDISNLETEQSNQDNRITTNESKLDTIQGNETKVDGRITTNEDDISDLQNINNINQSAEITKTVSGNSIEDFTLTGIFVIRLKGTDLNLKVNGKIVVSQRNIPYFVFSSGNNITLECTVSSSRDYAYREITFN